MGKLKGWSKQRIAGIKMGRNSLRRPRPPVSVRQTPPRELAGKWVAWSPDDRSIIASADTLAEVRAQAAKVESGRVSFEKLPPISAH